MIRFRLVVIRFRSVVIRFRSVVMIRLRTCHGSTGSPSALSEEDSKGGVTVLEGSKVLARGTRSCT